MFAEERREKILALQNEEKRVMAKDLTEKFQVSIDSIRRDLSIMEKQGLLKKTHGGDSIQESSTSTSATRNTIQ